MQALVLAGGEGTRLRPLTRTVPKPVMPLAGRPFLTFMLDWLRSHGVTEVILSCGFLSDGVHAVLGDIYEGMRLRYVIEDEPLGTAGPVRLALDEGLLEERLLVLNGDVLTDMDLTAELAAHTETGARGHAGADRRRGHLELRRGAHRRRRLGGGVPREVRRARRPPTASTPAPTCSSARWSRQIPAGRAGLLRARGLPGAGGQRAAAAGPPRATGSTSARPTATSRPPTTC